ncbi:hypothetical protein HDU97_002616 [Phlyctochytrium planicorne]|nr:hypothetical protein HDU97_002616 [Phlyctochytrium planicorne]
MIQKPYTLNLLLLGPGFEIDPLEIGNYTTVLDIFQWAAEAALADISIQNVIMKDTKVNLIPVQNWDERFLAEDASFLVDSGGYSAVKVYDAVQNLNIAGIIGDYYSATTRFSAGIASQLQVPHCGTIQGSPALTDSKAYPYFFRMLPGKNIVRSIPPMLAHYNVKKITIVYSKGYTWTSFDKTLVQILSTTKIQVAANIAMASEDDVLSTIDTMKRHQSKVIVALLQNPKKLYYTAANHSLVGPNTVWITINPFGPTDEEVKHSPEMVTLLNGVLMPVVGYQERSKAVDRFTSLYWRIQASQSNFTQWQNITGGDPLMNGYYMYDCFKVMLTGMQQYLNDNPHLTSMDLSNPRYRKDLSVETYSKTIYSRLGASQYIEFTPEGNLKSPIQFICFHGTVADFNAIVVGQTDPDLTQFSEISPPIFFGNTSSWPAEESTNELLFERGQIFVLKVLLGLAFFQCMVTMIHFFNHASRGIASDIPPTIMLIGCCLVLTASVFPMLERMSGFNCRANAYMQYISYGCIYSITATQETMTYRNSLNRFRKHREISLVALLASMTGSIIVNTVIIGILDAQSSPVIYEDKRVGFPDQYILLLYVFNGSLILLSCIMSNLVSTRSIQSKYSWFSVACGLLFLMSKGITGDPLFARYLATLLKTLISGGTSIYCMAKITEDGRNRLYLDLRDSEFGIFPPGAGAMSLALDMGRVHFYEKGNLSWWTPFKARFIFKETPNTVILSIVPVSAAERAKHQRIFVISLKRLRSENVQYVRMNSSSSFSNNSSNRIVVRSFSERLDVEEGSLLDVEEGNMLVDGVIMGALGKAVAIVWEVSEDGTMTKNGKNMLDVLRRCVKMNEEATRH